MKTQVRYLTRDTTGGYHRGVFIALTKIPATILVHRSLLRARLYLISLTPGFQRV